MLINWINNNNLLVNKHKRISKENEKVNGISKHLKFDGN